MKLLMGIDLGSTSLKANIYDMKGNLVASGKRPTEVSNLNKDHPEWVFWDPEKIWNDVSEAINEAVKQVEDPKFIKGIAVTGFGMDGLPVDKRGECIYPFISWHCSRTESTSKKWSNKIGKEKIFKIAGKQVMHIDTVYRLLWMMKNKPEILNKTDKWLLIEDYINFKLCGVKATDFSMASCTSLLDQEKQKWSKKLIKDFGIDMNIFPKLKKSGTVIGEVNKLASSKTSLPKGTPVVLGGHDYLCAALAAGAFQSDVILDITGTWEIVLQATNKPYLTSDIFNSGLTVDSHVAKDKFAIVGTAVSADMVEWFKKKIGFQVKKNDKNDWKYLEKNIQYTSAGSKGVFFLPHFSGAGSPINDSRSLGGFIGLSNQVKKIDMLRAVFEGLDYQLKEMVNEFENALNIKTDKIIAVGGAIKNKFWLQNKADVTGKLIEVPNTQETTSLGAAMLAGIGVGLFEDEMDAYNSILKKGSTFIPNEKLLKKYNKYYKIYKNIYPSLKNVNEEIYNEFKLK